MPHLQKYLHVRGLPPYVMPQAFAQTIDDHAESTKILTQEGFDHGQRSYTYTRLLLIVFRKKPIDRNQQPKNAPERDTRNTANTAVSLTYCERVYT